MGSFAVTLRTGRATAPAVTGAVSSVGQSRGLIIPWSLVRAQHGLPFSSCFSGLAGPAKFAADLVAQPEPEAGEPLQKSCGSWHTLQKPCCPFASMPGRSSALPFAAITLLPGSLSPEPAAETPLRLCRPPCLLPSPRRFRSPRLSSPLRPFRPAPFAPVVAANPLRHQNHRGQAVFAACRVGLRFLSYGAFPGSLPRGLQTPDGPVRLCVDNGCVLAGGGAWKHGNPCSAQAGYVCPTPSGRSSDRSVWVQGEKPL